jgi:hypothetical protein
MNPGPFGINRMGFGELFFHSAGVLRGAFSESQAVFCIQVHLCLGWMMGIIDNKSQGGGIIHRTTFFVQLITGRGTRSCFW